jgi:hypothetical protein
VLDIIVLVVDLIWSDIGILSNCLIQRVVSCDQKISSYVRTVKYVREEQLPSAFRSTSVTNLLRCCKTRFSSGKTGFLYYTGKMFSAQISTKVFCKNFWRRPIHPPLVYYKCRNEKEYKERDLDERKCKRVISTEKERILSPFSPSLRHYPSPVLFSPFFSSSDIYFAS